MSGQNKRLTLLAILGLMLAAAPAFSADKEKDSNKEKAKKEKTKSKPENPADIFKPTPGYEAKEGAERDYMRELEAEVEARKVPLPAEMNLELAWYSPHIKAAEAGKILRGWVRGEFILLETDKRLLIAVRREDGVERWRCELNEEIRYAPCVSRNNVVVNCNNYLIAIEKNTGEIRWRLLPRFVMSNEPLVIDPPAYPREYTKAWTNLESIYVGGWDGRIYNLTVRGRMVHYVKGRLLDEGLAAPEFDLYPTWHKSPSSRGIISAPIKIRDNTLYYTADDQNVSAVTRDGEEREPYFMLDKPSTGITVTGSNLASLTNSTLFSVYVGARDNNVYCLDRLTLKKKWAYPAGYQAVGNIMADEPATPLVYIPTENGKVNALRVTPSKAPTKTTPEVPESFEEAWAVPGAGVITASPTTAYIGLKRQADHPGFSGIVAVDKNTGKTLWKVNGETPYFVDYLEFHNSWSNPSEQARVFAITADNRIVALKEKPRDTGVQKPKEEKKEEVPVAPKKKDEKKADEAAGDKPADK
ncbi:MAG TPA: PQQ-binding-like beta-propeller repeat protein [Planctomycetota bacterium]|nr:PQQ-binding-like beta-propeller repeat protein [Planctomycetota bacterium]